MLISNFMKTPPVGAEFFHADRHTDAFHNFAKWPKNLKKIQFNTPEYKSHVRNVCKISQFNNIVKLKSPIRKLNRFVQNWNVQGGSNMTGLFTLVYK